MGESPLEPSCRNAEAGATPGPTVVHRISTPVASARLVDAGPDVRLADVQAPDPDALDDLLSQVVADAAAAGAVLLRAAPDPALTALGFEPDGHELVYRLPVAVDVPTAADMHALGVRLASLLRAGDVVIASGELGAGKTALTQGIGAGLQVVGPVISPTFVLSRVHPAAVDGPGLVHVDAYRLASLAEVDDLDLDASMATCVTVIEWGAGVAEQLSSDRLDVTILRSGDPDDERRTVYLSGVGDRWQDVDLGVLRRVG